MDDETTTLPTAQDDTVSRKCTQSTPPPERNKEIKRLPKSGRKSSWIAVLVTILLAIGTTSCSEAKPTESLGHQDLSVKYVGTREDPKETRVEFERAKTNLAVASDKEDSWNVEQVAAKAEKKADKKKSGKKNSGKKKSGKKNSGKKKADKKNSEKKKEKKKAEKRKAEKKKAEKKKAEKKKAEKKKAEKKKAEEERAARERAEQEQAAQQAAAEQAARQAAEQAAQEQARQAAEQAARQQAQMQAPAPDANVVYPNCAAVRAAGRAPLYAGEPGYHPALDRDHDGIACE